MAADRLRRLSRVLAPAVLTAVGGGAIILPNTVFLEMVKELSASYKNGFPIPIAAHTLKLLDLVKGDLAPQLESNSINPKLLENIKPFTVFGFDLYRIGWINSEYGGWLGIPEYFKYKDGAFPTDGIKVNKAPVEWSTPAGQQLRASFNISEEAKQFALASELLHFFRYDLELRAGNNIANLVLPLMLVRGLSHRFKLAARPKVIRYIVYSMVAAWGASMWVMCQDLITRTSEGAVDEALSSLGAAYQRGGLQYYESLLQRNLALRSLMGDKGPAAYTALGNETVFIRMKHKPVVKRAEYFLTALQQDTTTTTPVQG